MPISQMKKYNMGSSYNGLDFASLRILVIMLLITQNFNNVGVIERVLTFSSHGTFYCQIRFSKHFAGHNIEFNSFQNLYQYAYYDAALIHYAVTK
jgi:hypothetical protein